MTPPLNLGFLSLNKLNATGFTRKPWFALFVWPAVSLNSFKLPISHLQNGWGLKRKKHDRPISSATEASWLPNRTPQALIRYLIGMTLTQANQAFNWLNTGHHPSITRKTVRTNSTLTGGQKQDLIMRTTQSREFINFH